MKKISMDKMKEYNSWYTEIYGYFERINNPGLVEAFREDYKNSTYVFGYIESIATNNVINREMLKRGLPFKKDENA